MFSNFPLIWVENFGFTCTFRFAYVPMTKFTWNKEGGLIGVHDTEDLHVIAELFAVSGHKQTLIKS